MRTAVEVTGPTAATKQWESGKPKAGFPLSHCLRFFLYDQIQKGGLAAELRSFSRLTVRLEYALARDSRLPHFSSVYREPFRLD
jgi:hypothetical protein